MSMHKKFCPMMKSYMMDQQKMMKKCNEMMGMAPTKCAKDMMMNMNRDMKMHHRHCMSMYDMYCMKKKG